MSYCILRIKKIKSFGALASSCHHTFRDVKTPNADPQRRSLNQAAGARSTAAVFAAFRSKLPAKCRRNAVLGLEYLVTASPEFFADGARRSGYFSEALEWLKEKHGSEYVLSATVHRDETTPHLVVYVVPMTKDGRLSARDFCGGAKKLSQLQSDFHSAVGSSFGLLRSLKGSKAKHRTIARFYSGLNAKVELVPLGPFDHLGAAVGIETKAARESRQAEKLLAVRASRSGAEVLGALRQERALARSEAERLGSTFADHKQRVEKIIRGLLRRLIDARQSVRHLRKRFAEVVEELAVTRNENMRLLDTMRVVASQSELRQPMLVSAPSESLDRSHRHVKQ